MNTLCFTFIKEYEQKAISIKKTIPLACKRYGILTAISNYP